MPKKQTKRRFSVFTAILLALLALLYILYHFPSAAPEGRLAVHMIDVGQGDAIFIELPGGQTMLIDGGTAQMGETVVAFLRAKNVTRVDFLVATHPHADHIGGLPAVFAAFPVAEVFLPRAVHTTETFDRLLQAMEVGNARVHAAKAGVFLFDRAGCQAVLLGPVNEDYDSLNNASAVVKLTFGETSFLFLGDAEAASEADMLQADAAALSADVVKVGHHGSRTSSTKALVQAANTAYAVFSLGAGNTYGHPHPEALDRWAKHGAATLRTDERGTISFSSDGKTLTLTTER